jgi:hypothetical protein
LVLFVMKYMYPFSSISLIMYKIPDQVGDDDEVKPGMTEIPIYLSDQIYPHLHSVDS